MLHLGNNIFVQSIFCFCSSIGYEVVVFNIEIDSTRYILGTFIAKNTYLLSFFYV